MLFLLFVPGIFFKKLLMKEALNPIYEAVN